MEKLFIKNRKGQKLAVVVEQVVPQKGAIAEYAFVAKFSEFERGEAKIMRHIRSIWRIIFAKPQPNSGNCSRNDIRQQPRQGLAFVMHGLGGFKESPQTRATVESFLAAGYTVVSFDTTNTFGESDGNYEDATTTNYLEDLEDVIEWAKAEVWYVEPFVLAGHSLGGICVALYAQRHPEKIKGLAPLGTVVSGALSLQSPEYEKQLPEWERTGWRVTESASQPGRMKRLKWSHVADRLKYDLLAPVRHPERSEDPALSMPKGSRDSQDERDSSASGLRMTDRLIMPVLLVVGEKDESCPVEHQKILYAALPKGKKELHIIPGAPHTFREKAHLDELKRILNGWIESLAK